MINKKIGVLLLFALLISFGAKAQRATSMRINEVLVINEDNFVDDYGKRHGWIELFGRNGKYRGMLFDRRQKQSDEISDPEGRRIDSDPTPPAHTILG